MGLKVGKNVKITNFIRDFDSSISWENFSNDVIGKFSNEDGERPRKTWIFIERLASCEKDFI